MRTSGLVVALFVTMFPSVSRAQEISFSGTPKENDAFAACMKRATSKEDEVYCKNKPIDVDVLAKPPPRSASDWQVDEKTVRNAPLDSSASALNLVPGVFVSDQGLPGRAPHLSLRGFDGTSGQDVEILIGNIPLNQVAHLRAPGYADMRLVMPEVIKSIDIENGPYDPRQGDFAVAGSMRMNLGLEKPGFWAKSSLGSFGSRRLFLGFAPENRDFNETFAAFETDSTNGPGGTRGGERTSFVGQFGNSRDNVQFHVTVAIGAARFDFPGFLEQSSVEAGADPYAATQPLGRDRTSQALVGSDVIWRVGEGTLGIGAFAGTTKTTFHQDLTGYVLDELAGGPPNAIDDAEQVNNDDMVGLTTFYRHGVELTSKRDSFEMGVSSRVDFIDQTDTRLFPDGTRNGYLVNDSITATNIGAYADASLYPWRRLVIRGGPRLDSLSFDIKDRATNAGLDRTAQGFHVGAKATVDLATGNGVHLLASYGDGFRSPQAQDLHEGDRVPFTVVRGGEGGLRFKQGSKFVASIVGFGSWLSHDRVFDATTRDNVQAPPSTRFGAAAAMTLRSGPVGASVSATYARATFTESDATYKKGELVPYAPAFVLRDDVFIANRLGRVAGHSLHGRVGFGVEGVAGRPLPDGFGTGRDLVDVDGVAALRWRWCEVSVNGTNLLGLQYYDSQYVYVSNFQKASPLPPPTAHVLVAAPTAVFVSLQIHLQGEKSDSEKNASALCLQYAVTQDEKERCSD
jgi:iron complex outermembrane receptor protein